MLGLKKKTQRQEEQKKEEEETGVKKVKRSAGELRLKKELGELDLPAHCQCKWPDDENVMEFEAHIDLTKEDCLWKGGIFKFRVNVSPSYPHEAPKCHCDTQIYHPNIDMQGNVCLNILRADWKPVLGINAVILGLIYLFIEPNPNDPLNHEAAKLMRDQPQQFKDKVKRTMRGGNIDGHNFTKFL